MREWLASDFQNFLAQIGEEKFPSCCDNFQQHTVQVCGLSSFGKTFVGSCSARRTFCPSTLSPTFSLLLIDRLIVKMKGETCQAEPEELLEFMYELEAHKKWFIGNTCLSSIYLAFDGHQGPHRMYGLSCGGSCEGLERAVFGLKAQPIVILVKDSFVICNCSYSGTS